MWHFFEQARLLASLFFSTYFITFHVELIILLVITITRSLILPLMMRATSMCMAQWGEVLPLTAILLLFHQMQKSLMDTCAFHF